MQFITKPFKHQLDTFNSIKDLKEYALFWEMGTGKTKIVIDLIRYHCTLEKRILQVLIIAPNSVLSNWKKEFIIHSNIEPKYISILTGSKQKRIKSINCINIINFEGLRVIQDELIGTHWDIVIADESHNLKNFKKKTDGGKLSNAEIACRIAMNSDIRYIMTGTPILNNEIELFNQFRFLDKGDSFGDNFYQFRNKHFVDKNQFAKNSGWYYPKYEIRPEYKDIILNTVKKKSSRILKIDCLDLPPKIYETIELEMEEDQFSAYKQMETACIAFLKENKVSTAPVVLTKLLRLNQITSGFVKAEDDSIVRFKNNRKLKALIEIIETIGNSKVIIWAYFKEDMKIIHDEILNKLGIKCPILAGETKQELRQPIVDMFQTSPDCNILLAQPHTAGIGLTLTSASYAVYYSQGYSLADRLQSEDRCHRAGSQIHDKITYFDLVYKDTVDESIIKAVKEKSDLLTSVSKLLQLKS